MRNDSLQSYSQLKLHAAGAHAQVWRATHTDSGVPVAIKILALERAREPDAVAAIHREALAVSALHHPSVVALLDVGETPPEHAIFPATTPFLAMEWVDGGTLAEADPAADWGEVRRVAVQLLAALAHAHARGVVHADLKPANVLRTREGAARLADFGVARILDRDGPILGSPAYMAPEQFGSDSRAIGPWSDLYSLGCTIWELLCGEPPFGDENNLGRAHRSAPIPSLQSRVQLPDEVGPWLRRLLAKRPGDRYLSAADAARFLKPPQAGFGSISRTARPGLGLWGLRAFPMMGRERERETLWAELERAAACKKPRVVALTGGRGVGKTKLATWLTQRASELGAALVLTETAPDRGARLPLIDALRTHVGAAGLRGPRLGRRLDAFARRTHLPDPAFDALSDLLFQAGASTPASRHGQLLTVLEALAADRPVVAWIDDAHGDSGVYEVARLLADTNRRIPLLLVLTSHVPPPDGPWQTMSLQPLDHSESRALVSSMLDLAEDLCEQVAKRAEGNALFAVQLIGDWVARGVLSSASGGLQLAEGEEDHLPDSLYNLWASRIASAGGLDPSLELGAALGAEVDELEWARACEARGIVPIAVESWAQRGLLQLRGGRWAFAHGLLHETVERLARESGRWPAHNLACAAALEVLETPDADLRRGFHLLEGLDHERAITTLLRAAWTAFDRGDRHTMARALELRGSALAAAKAHSRHRSLCEQELARQYLCVLEDDIVGMVSTGRSVAEWAAREGFVDIEVRALEGLGQARVHSGEYAAGERELRRALALREPDTQGMANTQIHLGYALQWQGRLEEAELALNEARSCVTADPLTLAKATNGLADLARIRGDWAGCRDLMLEVLPAYTSCSYITGLAHVHNSLGDAERHLGDPAGAERHYREAQRLYASFALRLAPLAIVRLNLALVLMDLDRDAEAVEELDWIEDVLPPLERPRLTGAAALARAWQAARASDWTRVTVALDRHQTAQDEAEMNDPDAADLLERIGLAAADRGESDLARRALSSAMLQYRELGLDEDRRRVQAGLGDLD